MRKIRGKGIEVDTREYRKLHIDESSSCFLDQASQNILLDSLGRFLGRAKEDVASGKVTFSIAGSSSDSVGGAHEKLSRSAPLLLVNGEPKKNIPLAEIDALEAAVHKLLEKQKDSSLQRKSEVIIGNFRLPDPDRAPEMYRLYGRWNRRLGIVWGCERNSGNSVSPLQAIESLKKRGAPIWITWAERAILLSAILLLLLLLGWAAYMLWPRSGSPDLSPKPPRTSPDDSKKTIKVPLTKDGARGQYLRVQCDPPDLRLPNVIRASSKLKGTISFPDGTSHPVSADEVRSLNVKEPGTYRVLWKPDSDNPNINSEIAELTFPPPPPPLPPGQYLRVQADPPDLRLPSVIRASSKLKGTISFPDGTSHRVAADEVRTMKVKAPGTYRVDWKPDADNPNVESESAELTFPPAPAPAPAPDGSLRIIKSKLEGIELTLVAQLISDVNAPLENIVWRVGDKEYRGNSHITIEVRSEMQVNVEATHQGRKVRGAANVDIKIILDDKLGKPAP